MAYSPNKAKNPDLAGRPSDDQLDEFMGLGYSKGKKIPGEAQDFLADQRGERRDRWSSFHNQGSIIQSLGGAAYLDKHSPDEGPDA